MYNALWCTHGREKAPRMRKVPCCCLRLFNSLTLRIYELKDSSGILLMRLQHVLESVAAQQTRCFVYGCLFVKM